MRGGAGAVGRPGASEVVNRHRPNYLIKQGIRILPCLGGGRQSGTYGSPSSLHASPGAAAGGDIALLRTGDRLRIDLNSAMVDWLVSEDEIHLRRAALEAAGGYPFPASQTPWQELQRDTIGQLETGAALEPAVKYRRIVETFGNPRDNH